MIYSLIRKKWFIITCIIIFLTLTGLAVMSLINSAKPKVEIQNNIVVDSSTKDRVVIDKKEYKDILSDEQLLAAEKYIYSSLKLTSKTVKPSYSATVRSGSLRESTVNGAPLKTVLIDILTVKRTYIVSYEGSEKVGYQSIQADCAPDKDQMVSPSECVQYEQ